MFLTPHQIGEYVAAANRLDSLANELEAAEITPAEAATRLIQTMELLIEIDSGLHKLREKLDEIHAKRSTTPEQIRKFVEFLRTEVRIAEQ
ncbi:hypothetical protein [Mycobacteroides abscessus]|uniref:hypothetical protein n=1 Tax=Mycobacteroides abscessus TaxID=36809 RepID=UPI00092B867F|nr:hypothetical protein [Mycobacteroides abscessus]SHQ47768.1 Uncharacterised protein [Mycobacteroides abscessus subsp. abscessus]SKQ85945.1 Uncharacterised protein [Mycobacteroides abscessus subsp. massiliense]SLC48586.1 Uncharacterised protein [Mycobacteroides abscessus subsp. massiliense]